MAGSAVKKNEAKHSKIFLFLAFLSLCIIVRSFYNFYMDYGNLLLFFKVMVTYVMFLLLSFMIIYLYYTFIIVRSNRVKKGGKKHSKFRVFYQHSILYMLLLLVMLWNSTFLSASGIVISGSEDLTPNVVFSFINHTSQHFFWLVFFPAMGVLSQYNVLLEERDGNKKVKEAS